MRRPRWHELKALAIERRKRVLKNSRGRCVWCRLKLTLKTMTIDHLVPQSRWLFEWGSKNHISNLAASCVDCQRIKADIWLEGISLTPGPGPRTVVIYWNTARYRHALLRTSRPRRRAVNL